MIHSIKRITMHMCSLISAFVVRKPPKTGFLALRPKLNLLSGMDLFNRREAGVFVIHF